MEENKSIKIGLVTAIYFTKPIHLELCQKMLDSISTKHSVIKIAVVNRCDDRAARQWVRENFDYVILNDENTLARAWNKGINYALDTLACDYILLTNTDVIFQAECINNLVDQANHDWTGSLTVSGDMVRPNQVVAWCANIVDGKGIKKEPPPDFDVVYSGTQIGFNACVCLMNNHIRETVGLFHESYKGAYFEDTDVAERIADSLEYKALTVLDAKVFHFGSQTIFNDPSVRELADENFKANQERFYDRSRFRKIHLI